LNRAKRIATNLVYLLLGEGASVALAFVTTIWLARHLTDEGFGRLAFAQSIIMYLAILTDLGLAVFGTREMAKDRRQAEYIATNILAIRSSIAVLLFALLGISVAFLDLNWEMKMLLWGCGLTLLTQAWNPEFIFQGLERMAGIATWRILIQALYLIPVVLFVQTRQNLVQAPFFRFAAEFVAVVITAVLVWKIVGGLRLRSLDVPIWSRYIRESVVIALSVLVIRVYYSFDTFMLGILDRPETVGWYNAALKIVQLLIAMAGIIQASFAPVIAKEAGDSARLDSVISRFGILLTFVGSLASGTIIVLNRFIVTTLYGVSYINAATPLIILSLSTLVNYMATAFTAALIFGGRQKDYLKIVIISALVNLSLNAVLIPWQSYNGAALANLACNVTLLLAGLPYYRRMGSVLQTLRPMLIMAGVSMALVVIIGYLVPHAIAAAILFVLLHTLIMLAIHRDQVFELAQTMRRAG
jgi:O-antigen/teichoic acid export membrane protein